MTQDAFPFFNWFAQAFDFFFDMVYAGFSLVLMFLGRICELLVYPFVGAGERFIDATGWIFGTALPTLLGQTMQPLLAFVKQLAEWAWGQFGDVLGSLLLWLDGILPPSLMLDASGLMLVVAYIKAATSWFNAGLFLGTVAVGLTTNWTIAIAKIIWRSIPTIG